MPSGSGSENSDVGSSRDGAVFDDFLRFEPGY